jgi:hypothetical protein
MAGCNRSAVARSKLEKLLTQAEDCEFIGMSATDESAPSGGCMPIGLTAQGELVFPMQCDEERLSAASQDPVPTNSTWSRNEATSCSRTR